MKMDELHFYEICIEGYLSDRWSNWFDELAIQNDASGMTILTGVFIDQAALFGVLMKIHALNLTLVSVTKSSIRS